MDQALTIGARRRCDNCGKFYVVRAPHHRFDKDKCRAEFSRHGSPYVKLREKISAEAALAADAIEMRVYAVLDQPTRNRYATMYPARARHFDEQLRAQQQQAS